MVRGTAWTSLAVTLVAVVILIAPAGGGGKQEGGGNLRHTFYSGGLEIPMRK